MQFPENRTSNLTPVAAFLAVGFYAALAWFPPGPARSVERLADAMLLERLFPGDSAWWVVTRLLALFVGAGWLAWRLRVPARVPESVRERAELPPRWAQRTALALAVLQVIASLWADRFPRWGQAAFLAFLFAPALVVWLATMVTQTRQPFALPVEVLICGGLLLIWIPWRLTVVWHDPRITSLGDAWYLHETFEQAIQQGTNFLTSWHEPLVASTDMLLAGADLFHPGQMPSIWAMQTASVLWIAAAAALTALAVARLISLRTAPVAAAAVLASPLALSLAHWPFSWGFLLTFVALLLVLLVELYQRRSVTALLLLGPLVALTALQGFVAAYVPFAAVAAIWIATRKPRLPVAAFATAGLSLLATVMPYVSGVDLDIFRSEVVGEVCPWADVENYFFEQREPILGDESVENFKRAGRRGPFDLVIGGTLAPFLIPRTAVRLLGNALLEPWSAALTAMGLILCVRLGRQKKMYWIWLVGWGIGQMPMLLTSNYDRISPIRNMALPVASAPFVALAFAALSTTVSPLRRRFVVPVGAVALLFSGAAIHDWVNPRILATSSMQLEIEATNGNRPRGGAMVLDLFGGTEYVYLRRMGAHFPDPPLEVLRYSRQPLVTALPENEPIAGVFLWSPGLEQECGIAHAICAQMPSSVIYTMYSRSRLTRAFAASPAGEEAWSPRPLPQERWTKDSCASFAPLLRDEPSRGWCSPEEVPRDPHVP